MSKNQGNGIVQFVLVAPAFFLLALGSLQVLLIGLQQLWMQHRAFELARRAALDPSVNSSNLSSRLALAEKAFSASGSIDTLRTVPRGVDRPARRFEIVTVTLERPALFSFLTALFRPPLQLHAQSSFSRLSYEK